MRVSSLAAPLRFASGPNKNKIGQNSHVFQKVTYTEMLTLPPQAVLNPVQQTTLGTIESICASDSLQQLPQYLDSMANVDFAHILHIRYRPNDQSPFTMRDRFYTPFSDLYVNLATKPQDQITLIDSLAKVIRQPKNSEALQNAITSLVDIYGYALRPGGKAPNPTHQAHLLTTLDQLLSDPALPVKSRRLLQTELRFAQRDAELAGWHIGYHAVQAADVALITQQLTPLTTKPLPDYPTPPKVPSFLSTPLKQAIVQGDDLAIRKILAHPVFHTLIPDWQRATGAHNFQHVFQDYNLDDHLLGVLKATQASPHYAKLSKEDQFRVSTAALFHDIGKWTGPANFRAVGRIMADVHHPEKSAETVLQFLSALDYTPDQIEDIAGVIRYHQELGDLAKPGNSHSGPSAQQLQRVAQRLKTPTRLTMLRALTEGDVRCVRFDIPGRTWYTSAFDQRVNQLGDAIAAEYTKPTP